MILGKAAFFIDVSDFVQISTPLFLATTTFCFQTTHYYIIGGKYSKPKHLEQSQLVVNYPAQFLPVKGVVFFLSKNEWAAVVEVLWQKTIASAALFFTKKEKYNIMKD